jgi:hypothetical protein
MQNQNEPDIDAPEVVSRTRAANMSNIDYSKTAHTRFYAKHVGANLTMFEIRLILSNVDVENSGLVANSTVTLFMSPELASMANAALTSALFAYKSKYGKLRIPDTLLFDPAAAESAPDTANEDESKSG